MRSPAARWAEFDLAARLWVVPASRMKSGREHRVPLSGRAIEILKTLPREGEFVFIKLRRGTHLAGSFYACAVGAHGPEKTSFRMGSDPTFRDWAAERTNFPSEVAEMALAHTVGDKVEQAYARSDLFDRRRRLMEAWAGYCTAPAAAAEAIPINRTKMNKKERERV